MTNTTILVAALVLIRVVSKGNFSGYGLKILRVFEFKRLLVVTVIATFCISLFARVVPGIEPIPIVDKFTSGELILLT